MSAGWLLITYATNSKMILAGRAICGAISAIALPASYTYVAEIASSQTRGFLGSLLSVGWTFGLVLSYSLGSILKWNWLALTSAVVPLAQFFVLSVATPSPRWLISRNKMDEATKSITFFRGELNKHVECELKDCEHQLKVAEQNSIWNRIKMMVTSAGNRKAIGLCLGVYFCTVATGFIVVNYHVKVLLVEAKVAMDANLGTIIIGLCQMGGNIFSALIVDRVGRKTLLYVSSVFLCLSQLGLGLYFYVELERSIDLEAYRWAPLVLLIVFVVALPLGWGSITYILVSELVPTQIRTETAVLCNAWEQLLQFVVLQIHSSVCSKFGPHYLHWAFSVSSGLAGLFTYFLLPETSGKSLEEIETFFTHLRREAMDMIGDRAACREPLPKVPLFKVSLKKKPSSTFVVMDTKPQKGVEFTDIDAEANK